MNSLTVFVYRDSHGDSSNGGVSAKNAMLTLFWDATYDAVAAYLENHPKIDKDTVVLLNKRQLWGDDAWYAEPFIKGRGVGPMFGGTFIHTSDSRFPKKHPIPLHDRYESKEQYEILSR